MLGQTNTPPYPEYAVYTLQYNTTYSGQYIPMTQVWCNTNDIYLENNGAKFRRNMKVRCTICGTFNRSTGEAWMSLRDNDKNVAPAIYSPVGWVTLNIDVVYDVTTSSYLRCFMHDSGMGTSYSGIGSPTYMSQFIINRII